MSAKSSNEPHKAITRIHMTPIRTTVALFLMGIVYFQYSIPLETTQPAAVHVSKHEFVRPGQMDHGKIEYQTLSELPVLSKRDTPRYFMVFSTSCTDQQNWESYVFFFHAFKVQQKGVVSRIVSGCTPEQEQALKRFHSEYIATLNPNFEVHFTPDFSRVTSNSTNSRKNAYKYMNKPFGVRHWMENRLGIFANGTNPRNSLNWIIFLLDPDMILQRQFTHNFTDVDNHLWLEKNPTSRVVAHGAPFAQQDGYLSNEWMKLDFEYITQKQKPDYVAPPLSQQAPIHWNTGPPYIATAKDMRDIVAKWTEYAPRVHDVFPKLFAEMYGFIIATHQLKLPFTLIKSLVVSTTQSKAREGWSYVDSLNAQQICEPPPLARLPMALHYCKRYRLGRNFFSKYRIKKNILRCDKPLLKPIEQDLLSRGIDWYIKPPVAFPSQNKLYNETREKLKERPHRELFMLCGMTKSMNEALRFFKQRACVNQGIDANLNETYSIYEDPTNY